MGVNWGPIAACLLSYRYCSLASNPLRTLLCCTDSKCVCAISEQVHGNDDLKNTTFTLTSTPLYIRLLSLYFQGGKETAEMVSSLCRAFCNEYDSKEAFLKFCLGTWYVCLFYLKVRQGLNWPESLRATNQSFLKIYVISIIVTTLPLKQKKLGNGCIPCLFILP